MKKYISFVKLKFITGLQYRAAALAGLATQLFFGFVFIMVYMAYYNSNTNTLDFGLKELITYLWLNQIFFSLIYIGHNDNELLNIIRNGDIAYELCRPVNLYIMWFARILGTKSSAALLKSVPLIVIICFLPQKYSMSLPISIESFIFFIISMSIAAILISSLVALIYIISSLTIDDKGIRGIFNNIATLLSGQTVPLPFLPLIVQKILSFLPFAYISDFSFRVYTGNIAGIDVYKGVIIQIIWCIIIIILGVLITNKVTKKITVQGG